MKKLFLLLLFLISCNELPAFKEINPLVKELSELYNTIVTYKVGIEIQNKRRYNYIEVRIKESDIIQDYPDKHIPASYIAVFLAKKVNYDEYRIEFYNDKETTLTVIYCRNDIQRILDKLNYFDKINQMFIHQEYGKIYDLADKIIKSKLTKETLMKQLIYFDNQYGKIDKIITHGYKIIDRIIIGGDKVPVVGYYAIFRRKNGDMRTSVFINETDNQIVLIKFDW